MLKYIDAAFSGSATNLTVFRMLEQELDDRGQSKSESSREKEEKNGLNDRLVNVIRVTSRN